MVCVSQRLADTFVVPYFRMRPTIAPEPRASSEMLAPMLRCSDANRRSETRELVLRCLVHSYTAFFSSHFFGCWCAPAPKRAREQERRTRERGKYSGHGDAACSRTGGAGDCAPRVRGACVGGSSEFPYRRAYKYEVCVGGWWPGLDYRHTLLVQRAGRYQSPNSRCAQKLLLYTELNARSCSSHVLIFEADMIFGSGNLVAAAARPTPDVPT